MRCFVPFLALCLAVMASASAGVASPVFPAQPSAGAQGPAMLVHHKPWHVKKKADRGRHLGWTRGKHKGWSKR